RYTVRVQMEGFRASQRDDVGLAVDTSVRLDVTLEVGEVTQDVTVRGSTPLLQDTPSIATGVTRQEFERLPLVQIARNRSPATFVFLAPGVRGTQDLIGTDNVSASNHINVHGGQIRTNEIWVEGLPAGQSRLFGNFNEAAPSVDAINEFRVQTSLLSAEYGITGVGVTSFSLKSGTNELHGAVHEYLRHHSLDARNPFSDEKARTQQSEFGGSLGGPVRLGPLYDGRDRTFFFASYGASRRRGLDIFSQTRIPTPANLRGDFSDLRDSRGALIPIYDPATTRVGPDGMVERTPFPGNIIPQDRIDPATAQVAEFFPAPNASGTLNYTGYVGEKRLDPTTVTIKVDHALTPAQRLAVSAIWTDIPRLRPDTTLPEPLTAGNLQMIRAQTWRVNHTAVLSPTLISTAYFGYNRFENEGGAMDLSTDWPASLGIPDLQGIGFPSISFGQGYSNIGQFGRNFSNDHTWMAKQQLTWIRGAHEVMVGGEVRQNMYDNALNHGGSLSFSNRETADPSRLSSTGDPIASFLLGQVDSASIQLPLTTGERRWYYGAFVQDTWRVRPDVTISAGLRWEVQTPPYERDDRSGLIDLTVPNPAAGNRPGAVVYAGDGEGRTGRRTFADTDYSAIGPRVGVAWRPRPDTLVKGGYGIYYTTNDVQISSPGFRATADPTSPDNGLSPAFLLSDGFTGIVPSADVTPTLLNGQDGAYLEQSSVAMPRSQNWAIGIQHELAGGVMLEASYVGLHNTRLTAPALSDVNQVDPRYLSLGALLTSSIDSPEAQAAGLQPPYPGFSGSVAQALRAFPQYQRLTSTAAKLGETTYHGLEVRAARQFSDGLSFQVSYTYSHNSGLAPDKMGFGVIEIAPACST
ncbi:MAG: TonB-dependent receptor domain-containing protein, partial [Vicinamibacteraceae bacterium]